MYETYFIKNILEWSESITLKRTGTKW